jgi:hypothetical protein
MAKSMAMSMAKCWQIINGGNIGGGGNQWRVINGGSSAGGGSASEAAVSGVAAEGEKLAKHHRAASGGERKRKWRENMKMATKMGVRKAAGWRRNGEMKINNLHLINRGNVAKIMAASQRRKAHQCGEESGEIEESGMAA